MRGDDNEFWECYVVEQWPSRLEQDRRSMRIYFKMVSHFCDGRLLRRTDVYDYPGFCNHYIELENVVVGLQFFCCGVCIALDGAADLDYELASLPNAEFVERLRSA